MLELRSIVFELRSDLKGLESPLCVSYQFSLKLKRTTFLAKRVPSINIWGHRGTVNWKITSWSSVRCNRCFIIWIIGWSGSSCMQCSWFQTALRLKWVYITGHFTTLILREETLSWWHVYLGLYPEATILFSLRDKRTRYLAGRTSHLKCA